MSKLALSNSFVSINSVDLSDHCHDENFTQKADALENTAMGATTHTYQPGLLADDLSITFYQDYGAGSVDATLSAILSGGVAVAIELRPVNTTVGATNPKWTGSWMLESYEPISGTVGGMQMCKATFKPAGAITRATA